MVGCRWFAVIVECVFHRLQQAFEPLRQDGLDVGVDLVEARVDGFEEGRCGCGRRHKSLGAHEVSHSKSAKWDLLRWMVMFGK